MSRTTSGAISQVLSKPLKQLVYVLQNGKIFEEESSATEVYKICIPSLFGRLREQLQLGEYVLSTTHS